jgi:TRAP-type mannitol/chloroaromatic compound transport system permease small subunit
MRPGVVGVLVIVLASVAMAVGVMARETWAVTYLYGLSAILFAAFLAYTLTNWDRMIGVSQGLASFCIGVGKTIAWLLIPMMLIILYDVVTRSAGWGGGGSEGGFFNWLTSSKLQELEWHLHGVLLLMCFAYAYVKDAHVRIELLRDGFSLRLRAWIEMVGIVVGLFFYCYVVIHYGFDFAERSYVRGEGSSAMTGLSDRWIIKSFLPLGFLFVAYAGFSVLLRCIIFLYGPPHLRDESGDFLKPKSLIEDEAETLDEAVADIREIEAQTTR